jgi:hypothetical protein
VRGLKARSTEVIDADDPPKLLTRMNDAGGRVVITPTNNRWHTQHRPAVVP